MELREPMSEEPADFDPFASGPLAAWVPTTDPQREILSSALVAGDASAAFNQTLNIRLAGRLDVPALYRALTALAMRHDALRASIAADGLSLVIADVVLVPIEEEDFTTDAVAAAERLRRAEAEEVTVPLDLLRGPLIRARLCRLGEELHHLLVTIHHVVCDGWSIGIIYRDLAELYAAEVEQRPTQLAPAPSFVEYALARASDRDSGAFDEALRYWLDTYRELPTVLDLPYDKPRPAMRTFAAATITGRTDNETAAKLKRLGASNNTTLLATLYASFQAFVARITGIDDIVVGIFSAGQMQHGMAQLVGHCVNMLPVRTSFQPEASFGDLARAVHGTLLDAQDYQQCTFGTLINHLAIRRDASRLPLSPIVFNLDRAAPPLSFGNVDASMEQVARDRETFEWFVNVVEQPEGLHLEWTYNTDLFSRQAMQHLLESYVAFLESIAGNGGSAVSDVAVITREHQERLLARAGSADPRLVHGSFLEWVREHAESEPTRCAVEDESGQTITYGELWSRAGRIAAGLARDGIAHDDVVGVMIERSALLPAVLLGVLRSGAAYLPLDPDFPAGRLAYMVEDSGAALVITDQTEPAPGDVRLVSPQSIELAANDTASSALPCSDALAYVLYTSGSTGQPKGVEITHGALRNFLGSMRHQPGLSRDDVLFAVTTLSFDISGLELYLPLCAGARVVIASKETASDGYALAKTLESSGATTMQATPATWRMLADSGWSGRLKKILCGGEALPEELARALVPHADEVWNLYGPTETTIWSTAERIDGQGPVTVGHPIANTRIHVLDTRGGLVPDGVHGEIWIGGSGVARGYRNRADLTADRFLDDPFVPGERMYRTGDMGRWRIDGRLEHLGRLDFQVKVNGFRIELGEVESAFETLGEIRQAVVMARGTTEERRLVAYVVFEDGKSLLSSEVRRRLGDRLPQYMVPGVVVALDRLPLTPNGKVDRKALPDPFEAGLLPTERQYEAPSGAVEQAIAEVWRDVLGVERIGRHDNFLELGGHSLKGVQVAARLNSRGIQVSVRDLLSGASVAALVPQLDSSTGPEPSAPGIPRRDPGSQPSLSLGQERLWVLSKLEDLGSAYNQSQLFHLYGELQKDVLDRALARLTERHSILRSSYPQESDTISVRVMDPAPWVVPVEDAGDWSAEQIRGRISEWDSETYDLERGPLFRTLLLRLSEADYVLALGLHHIISDGWSWDILLRELSALYREGISGEKAELEPLPIDYFDYSFWQRERLSTPVALGRDLEYWTEQLSGAVALDLPTKGPRPAVQSHMGDTVTFEIDGSLKAALESVSRAEGATLVMALLALFQLLLARYSGQNDVVVGIPEAGRGHSDIEGLLGYFANTVVIRTAIDDNLTVRDLFARVSERVLGGIEHANVPFDRVVHAVDVQRDLSRSPVFQAMFSYQAVIGSSSAFKLHGLRVTEEDIDHRASMFDITLWLREVGDGLRCDLEYTTDLFDREFIEQCARSYVRLLEHAVESPGAQLKSLPLAVDTDELVQRRAGVSDTGLVSGTVLDWVEEQVRMHSARCAVTDEAGTAWSYDELWKYSSRVASGLAARGIGHGDLVGVMLSRSAPVPGIVLAILRCGAAYLPLDPDFPADRLTYMAQDGGVRLVVSDGELLDGMDVVTPAELLDTSLAVEEVKWPHPVAEDLAYVIYTSGSTGRPKGVEITHGSLRNFIGSMRERPGLTSDDVLLAVTTLSFDISGLELLLPLCVGARVVVAAKETASDGYELRDRLEECGATVMQATPASWRMLLDAGWDGRLRKILCGGEALPEELARELVGHADEVWNLYGPTETTIWSTLERITGDGPVLVGRPIANTRVYVLDRHEQLVPDGVHGEVWIAGAGVARGYRNRPDLTAERFKADPFLPGERMYRTGDMGRWHADGRVEHLGRLDFQVKVHGYRIELGEIENAFETLSEVRQAVVMARGTAEERRLVAYIVFEDGKSLLSSEVRRRLSDRLPQYMVPGVVVALDRLPLTLNGKVDRKALPDPFEASAAIVRPAHEEPEGVIEQSIADVWKELLGVERVSRHDNFFELGGHSLLAVQAAARLAGRTGIELNPRELVFRNVMQLAGLGGGTLSAAVDDVPPSDTAADVDAESADGPPAGLSRFVGRIGRVIQRRR